MGMEIFAPPASLHLWVALVSEKEMSAQNFEDVHLAALRKAICPPITAACSGESSHRLICELVSFQVSREHPQHVCHVCQEHPRLTCNEHLLVLQQRIF